jgi:beta-1,4-N-acetylglucosaminyltransferase
MMRIIHVFAAVVLALAAVDAALVWQWRETGSTTAAVAATVVTTLVVGVLRLWAVLPPRVKSGDGRACTPLNRPGGHQVATLVVLGSGGHTTEMLRLMAALDRSAYTPRTYVYAETDTMSPGKLRAFEGGTPGKDSGYAVRLIPRTREVRQSFVGTLIGTVRALAAALPLIFSTMPDLVLTNGPGTCIPLCIAA